MWNTQLIFTLFNTESILFICNLNLHHGCWYLFLKPDQNAEVGDICDFRCGIDGRTNGSNNIWNQLGEKLFLHWIFKTISFIFHPITSDLEAPKSIHEIRLQSVSTGPIQIKYVSLKCLQYFWFDSQGLHSICKLFFLLSWVSFLWNFKIFKLLAPLLEIVLLIVFFRTNQQKANIKFCSWTQYNFCMNRRFWRIFAGNEKRIINCTGFKSGSFG